MKDITYSLDEIIEIIKKITDKNYLFNRFEISSAVM